MNKLLLLIFMYGSLQAMEIKEEQRAQQSEVHIQAQPFDWNLFSELPDIPRAIILKYVFDYPMIIRFLINRAGRHIPRIVVNAHEGTDGVSFSPDGTMIISYSFHDGTAKLWTQAGELLHVFKGHNKHGFEKAIFNNAGTIIATASNKGMVKLWDVTSRTCIQGLKGGPPGEVRSLSFNSTDNKLLGVYFKGCPRVWNLETGAWFPIGGRKEGEKIVLTTPGKILQAFFIKRNDLEVIIAIFEDGNARVYDTIEGNCIENIIGDKSYYFGVYNGQHTKVAVNAHTLLEGDLSGDLTVFDCENGERVCHLGRHFNTEYDMAFSPKSRLLLSADMEGEIRFWNSANGKTITKLKTVGSIAPSAIFSPDGNKALVGGYHEFWIMDIAWLRELRSYIFKQLSLKQAAALYQISAAALIEQYKLKKKFHERNVTVVEEDFELSGESEDEPPQRHKAGKVFDFNKQENVPLAEDYGSLPDAFTEGLVSFVIRRAL